MWEPEGRSAAPEDEEDALLGTHQPPSPSSTSSFVWRHCAEIVAACAFLCGISAGATLVASLRSPRAPRAREDLPRPLHKAAPARGRTHARGLLRRGPRRAGGAAAPGGQVAAASAVAVRRAARRGS
ncbi:unnamed protein product [Prorocentrum cordatum]|uniref:Uncharacterized protein n=1 Tax=Prorocentrum cordatum TaxID=2364126 RepID=A0ABN9YFK1_9DINO|nr:unnamed protein product [Polarella glacialis]